MTLVPTSTGIGAPSGSPPAPANLSRSAMAPQAGQASGQQAANAIPFTRGSSLATMQDYTNSATVLASPLQVQLQTNAYLAYLVIDLVLTTAGNSATTGFNSNATGVPGSSTTNLWNVIASISLNDPANQAIITPISGYSLYLLNKYLTDTGCYFDPALDSNYSATSGSGATGGSFSFRLVVPVEHRRRDALGAVNNSAANQRYLLQIQWISSLSAIYSTAPSIVPTTISVSMTQMYWTSPPSAVTTSAGSNPVQQSPSGLNTVGFVRYERHNEVSGGGAPQIQLNNVGDYLSGVLFVLRNATNSGNADQTDWPGASSSNGNSLGNTFNWWVNDYQVHQLTFNFFIRELTRFYRYTAGIATIGGLDTGVFPLWALNALFDRVENFAPANQYLPTDATTKLQIRGSTFGTSASYLEVITRAIRPVSGAALFN